LLESRFSNNNFVSSRNYILIVQTLREREFTPFFSKAKILVFCSNVHGILKHFNNNYYQSQWQLFIDSSKTSLKAVLLHNKYVFASVPVGHSVHLKEKYNNVAQILDKIRYDESRSMICGDFIILTMLLGQQSGYSKYPCFRCLWGSRARNHN